LGGSSSGTVTGGHTAAGGSGGSVGSGGSTSGTGGTGGGHADGGGTIDSGTGDALDAPAPGDDGATSFDVGPGVDSGIVIVLDSGTVDSQGVDAAGIDVAAISLDAQVDAAAEDAAPDSPPVDAGVDGTESANCIQRIINAGWASGSLACSSCLHETECKNMINCLANPGPDAGVCTGTGSCELTCKNTSGADAVTETCVLDLVNDACK
jgi:hypothetical protein